MIECPKLKQYFGVDTFLVQRTSGWIRLYTHDARNSVSLEHAHMVNRGSNDGYLEIAKLKLRPGKIANRMDEIMAVIMQNNAYRQQAQFQTYPRPTINPINQMITSPAEADKIGAAALQEAEEIMAIVFPSGTQPPVVIADHTDSAISTTHSHPGHNSHHSSQSPGSWKATNTSITHIHDERNPRNPSGSDSEPTACGQYGK